MKVVLVHGYVNENLGEELTALGYEFSEECYQEGGYMLTVAADLEITDGDDLIQAIYAAEDDIPDTRDTTEQPIFTGTFETPIRLVSEKEIEFDFMGGYHGYEEDGVTRYEE